MERSIDCGCSGITTSFRLARTVRLTVFGRRTDPLEWTAVLERLPDSGDRIQVVVTNGRSKAGLDYEAYRESGLSVIAIGGDKLSRGLTLEGLTVSYFLRISKQYDSLLQMGRWFGYRRGFADVCRLYTTPDMEDWFRHVATANKELRSQLAHMQLMLATPKEYGLRVAGHSIMGVTAANKQAVCRAAAGRLCRRRQDPDGHVPGTGDRRTERRRH